MMRLTIFIIALVLAVGSVEPTGPWLVTLAVLSGLELLRWRPWPLRPRRIRRWAREWFDPPWREEYDW